MSLKLIGLTTASALAFSTAAAAQSQTTTTTTTPPAATQTQPATTTTRSTTTQTTTQTPPTTTTTMEPSTTTTDTPTTTTTQSTTTQTTETQPGAGEVTAATAADLKAGMSVYDQTGALVGKVDSVKDGGAIVNTGKARAEIPLTSFGKSDKGLVVGTTKSELDAAAKKDTKSTTKPKTVKPPKG